MATGQQIQQVIKAMTPAQLEQVGQELALTRAIREALAKEGKMLAHDGHAWVIVDVPVRKTLPDVPNIMHDDSLTVLSNHTVNAALASFHNAQSRLDIDWHRGERLPTFMYQKEQGTVFIELRPQGKRPDDDSMLTAAELAQAWAQLTGQGGERRITSLTGIVLHILLGQALGSPPDASGNRWITAEQILDYRGIKKVTKATSDGDRRSAGHRTEDIEAIGAVMTQLHNTWVQLHVKIVDDTDSRGRKRKREYSHQSRIIAITSTITQKEIIPESTSTMPIAWAFALGTWAEPFLQGANRYTAKIPQQCLAYDPYHEVWELRLSEYLSMALRTNASHGSTIPRQIGPVIKELSLPIDERNAVRTRQSFERAMNRIRDDGVISAWHYSNGTPKLKRYGWLADWLNLSIEVTASNGTKQQYRQIAERSETRRHRAEALEAAKQSQAKGKEK